MRFLYNTILKVATLIILPFLPFMLISKKIRNGFSNRLGWLPKEKVLKIKELPEARIWFHAASVGELSVVAPIVHYLKERDPGLGIIVTTMTMSGLNHVAAKIPQVDCAFIAPLDYPGVVKRVVKLIAPTLLVIAETEIWPNLILSAKKAGSQLALVNGRLSEKNVGRYKLMGSLITKTLEKFELLTIQSETDAERFIQLGANPQRIKILGNVKSDDKTAIVKTDFRKELRLQPEQPVWIAGSTRPGEEELIIDAFIKVKEKVKNAVLILAPRHLERLREVERLLTAKKQAFTLRTKVSKELIDFPVILLDTMGELAGLYGVGQVAFIGGTLAPFGGHNPLEPALLGVPVVMGPHTDHFSKTTEMLVKSKGAVQVKDVEALAGVVERLLANPKEQKTMGERAKKAVADAQGNAGKTAEMLQKLMLIKQWASEVKTWRQDAVKNNNYNQQKETAMDDDWLLR